ncbi:MAG TPA: hypothetical protein VGL11_21560 [Candidatus Binatia bacterium]|jgi:hypothetical protein
MNFFSDVKMYWRFAAGLRDFLRHTVSLEEARAIVRRRMAERENNFLRLLERGIFGYPRSPYLPLLKLAGCEMGDLRNMVRAHGLEGTLGALRRAGVYVTFEEFKGKIPIVRNGQTIPVRARDFDNPYLNHYYSAETGGTTGAGTRIAIDLDHLAADTPFNMLALDAQGVLNAPKAIWRGVLPDGSGLNYVMRGAKMSRLPEKWFTPITREDYKPAVKYRLATRAIALAGRLSGVPIPRPEPITFREPGAIARWARDALLVEGRCLIFCLVSNALRVCVAAQKLGIDLTGATFEVGGEPPTISKANTIAISGARCYPTYHFGECGRVGMGCARPVDGNDVHFFKDGLAVIQHPRQVPGFDLTVQAFCFTTLLPTVPKLMLNTEIDDYGVIETRSCGCPLEDYGYSEHIREIRSFRKLTGEGVTLVGSEIEAILEEILPARFGGSPLDYQLLEEEDEKGFTKLSLLVSPAVAITDETAVIRTLLEALGRQNVAGGLTRAIWGQAKTLRIKRMEPLPTARGKLMPLHLIQRASGGRPLPPSRERL